MMSRMKRLDVKLGALIFLGALVFLPLWGGCSVKYPKCGKDADCHAKEFCINGECQQCRDNHDCSAGQVCNKGRCDMVSSSSGAAGCTDDVQCPANQSCIDGRCRPCASDNECGDGGKCNAGRCARPAGASSSSTTPPKCNLEPVYFDFNEAVLSSDATSTIERNADCIKKSTGHRVILVGRTDPRGTEEYNLALSDRRAASVKDRLSRIGVDSGRMKTVAKGELEATGNDEGGWAKDRRVDFQW